MTHEQLKKLAEIAGITHTQDFDGVGMLFYSKEDAEWIPWIPDEIVDQAMMVVNGIPEEQRYHYIDELKKIVPLYSDGWYLINATASQRCAAALAIGG